MKGTAVVSGAAGFIGSHLVDLLLKEGFSVIGVDNLRTGNEQNLNDAMKNQSFRFEKLDILNSDLFTTVRESVDVIFHLAAISSVKFSVENPAEVNKVNVGGTVNMLELARKRDAKRFVFTSSAAIYGDPRTLPVTEETQYNPLSPYAASKIAAEMYSRAYGNLYDFAPTIFRFFNVYGPRQEDSEYSGVIPIFINQSLQNKDITIEGDGSHTRSFIYVEDVAEAAYLSTQIDGAANQILNLSGSDSVSVLDLAHTIKRVIPDSSSKIVHGPSREGDIKDSIGSMKKTSKVLDFTPKVSFETGLARTVSWYRSNSD